MGYADFLKQMLKPLGVYNLTEGYSAAELDALGYALDGVDLKLQEALSGCVWSKAHGEQLSMLEALFPMAEFGETEEERRENLRILFGVDDTCSNTAALGAQLKACGAEADIVEANKKFVVELHFTEIRGEPDDRVMETCRAVMPAHIALKYICPCVIWDRVEELYPKWDQFENSGLTVREIMELE